MICAEAVAGVEDGGGGAAEKASGVARLLFLFFVLWVKWQKNTQVGDSADNKTQYVGRNDTIRMPW